MWSIGNEVLEQWSSAEADTLTLEQANLILNAGHDASTLAQDGELSVNSLLTQHLAEIVKRYDTSRPITAGCNEPSPGNHLFKSGAIDLIGFNYHPQWTKEVPVNFPDKPFIFTESCMPSRRVATIVCLRTASIKHLWSGTFHTTMRRSCARLTIT